MIHVLPKLSTVDLLLYDFIWLKFPNLQFSGNFNHFKIMFFQQLFIVQFVRLEMTCNGKYQGVKKFHMLARVTDGQHGRRREVHLHQARILKIYQNTNSSRLEFLKN